MARPKEIAIELHVCSLAEKHGLLERKLQYPGKKGAPDRMFVGKDCGVVFIEFKRPGEKRNGLQVREGNKLLARGAKYYCIDNAYEACVVLGIPYEE